MYFCFTFYYVKQLNLFFSLLFFYSSFGNFFKSPIIFFNAFGWPEKKGRFEYLNFFLLFKCNLFVEFHGLVADRNSACGVQINHLPANKGLITLNVREIFFIISIKKEKNKPYFTQRVIQALCVFLG